MLRLENSLNNKREIIREREWVCIIYKTRKQFYTGREWRRVSKEYAQSKNFLCERCLQKGLVVPYEEVHHKIRITKENINCPEITLNWKNLECLCKKCHEAEHEEDAKERYTKRSNYQEKHRGERRRYFVDNRTGKIILPPDPEEEIFPGRK